MREILFRGKRVDTGEWNYGVPIVNTDCVPPKYMMLVCVIGGGLGIEYKEVISETVGQYTGIKDKNGKMIFEGDIIKRTIHCSYSNDGMAYDVLFQVPRIQELYGNKIEKDDAINSVDLWETSFEVIGNIHDQKEDV